jgi:sporulation-control protein spo0M
MAVDVKLDKGVYMPGETIIGIVSVGAKAGGGTSKKPMQNIKSVECQLVETLVRLDL